MPAKSKTQQRLFGMVHAHQKGELDMSSLPADLASKVKEVASSMKKTDAKKMAKTKHKGLPEEIKEQAKTLTFKQFLQEVQSNT